MSQRKSLGILALLICLSGFASVYVQASTEPLLLVGGKQLALTVRPLQKGNSVLIWVRDLERAGLGKVSWDPKRKIVTISGPGVRLAIKAGERRATVWAPAESSADGIEKVMPYAAAWKDGHVMVPLDFVCQELGIGYRQEMRLVISLSLPGVLSAVDHPTPGAKGAIAGRVFWGQSPAENVVLRLVRASDFAFLPNRKATTDEEGKYEFRGVKPGEYHVFAYVNDNPDYFNRYTTAVTVPAETVLAPEIHLGKILRCLAPPTGASLVLSDVVLSWTPCDVAQAYIVSVVDLETGEEVFAEQLTAESTGRSQPATQIVVPKGRLQSACRYQWSVIATDQEGRYVGGSPGAGLPPWTFTIGGAESIRQPSC